MTQSKHTPAPWIISENNNKEKVVLQELRTTPSGRDVQEKVCTIENQLDWKERNANAKLIAAAPELLEACELVAKTIANPNGSDSDFEDVLFSAIAKAKGE